MEMHVTNGAEAQKTDPELDAVLQWLGSKKKADLRMLLGECIMTEEGQMMWRNCQNFTSLQGTLYLCSTPKGENEDLLLFVVPKAHWTATLNGCHRDAGHQGHDQIALPITRMFLVARNGQTNETGCKDLLTLPPIQGQQPQGPFMPYSGNHSIGPLTC